MDSTKRSLQIDRIPRRDSGSTIASEKYSPMPHGRWTLDIHGNCPQCHHHHTAVTVQVTVSSNSAQASHVYCEKCKQKWLAFGGRNVTQISLLSTKTTEPDPVEKDFRYSLVHMVKSATAPATAIATAIAAPSAPLPDIPESSRTPSRDRSLRAQNLDIPQTVPGPSSITVMAQSTPSGSLLVAPSIHSHKNRSFGRRRIQIQSALIEWKQKLKDKFPILRQIRSKYSKNELLGPRTASKGKEKQRQDQKPSEPTMTSGEQLASVNLRTDETTKVSPTEVDQVNSHAHYSSADDAINSLKKFDKEIIRQMSREERVKWVRDQITAFKAQRFQELSTKADNEPGIPPMINNSTQIYHAELQPFPFVASRPQRRHSVELDIVGLGTQFSLSDLYNPSTPTLHNRPLSISDTCVSQMSQADTAVDDTAVSASQRLSYLSQHERQRSPSPRPRSSYSQAHLRQQVLQGRVEARTSLDSAGTAAAVRSMSTAGRRMNRVSVQSMGSLLQANPDPSGSQTQLPPPLPGAVGPNRSREVVYSDSTPNLNEYHPPNEDNRRSTD